MNGDVAVVDYGWGNLFSVCRALEKLGARPFLAADPDAIRGAPRVFLPGVGAFGDAMRSLSEHGIEDALREAAGSGRPFLGICLGAQLLLERGTEHGVHKGLGLIRGSVERLPERDSGPKVPNVGWRRVAPPASGTWEATPFRDLKPGAYAYFVHSYHAVPADPCCVIATEDFGGLPIAAALMHENVVGIQFHPEKSAAVGHAVLAAWLRM
jgi:imidazole glycerol-phosphate synthase subunit HisH